jgi:aspartyl-tRNA(Asn)/glutamyl-tRNA(Gln) amidotransferase subunit C
MPKADKDTIEKLAHLARLEFDENEKKEIEKDLNKMLDFVSRLNDLDTSRTEPIIYMNAAPASFRKDGVDQIISKSEALQNAPQKDSDYIQVPKVIEKK